MSFIELTTSDGFTLDAYRSDPTGTPRGAVVVVQEIFGVNSHIRSVADRFAVEGYVAIAPAIFDRTERGVELGYDAAGMKRGFDIAFALDMDLVMADVAAAVALGGEILSEARTGPVFVVGFCFGGTIAARAAIEIDAIAAAVGYYGSGIARSLLDRRPNVPLLLQYGELDHGIPLADVDEVGAAWPDVEIVVHAGAGHGFNCDQRDSFSPEASADAWTATLELLAR
jgi:carboxymethylenebutenolidase